MIRGWSILVFVALVLPGCPGDDDDFAPTDDDDDAGDDDAGDDDTGDDDDAGDDDTADDDTGDDDTAAVNTVPFFVVGSIDAPTRAYRHDGEDVVLAWTATTVKQTCHVALADYDGDGDADLAVGNGCMNPDQDRRYRNDALTFVPGTHSSDYIGTHELAWGHYDGDGVPDLVTGDSFQVRVHTPHHLDPAGDWEQPWTHSADFVHALAWDDCDGDGDHDLAVGASSTGEAPVHVFLHDGVTLTLAWTSTELEATHGLDWGDADGDGDLDLAAANADIDEPNRVYRNDGGSFSLLWASPEISPGTHHRSEAIAWGDYDGDGDADLAVGNMNAVNQVFRNDGVAGFTLAWESPDEMLTMGLVWGDLDGDGDLDLLAGNGFVWPEPNQFFRNDGGDVFTLAWESAEVEETWGIAYADR